MPGAQSVEVTGWMNTPYLKSKLPSSPADYIRVTECGLKCSNCFVRPRVTFKLKYTTIVEFYKISYPSFRGGAFYYLNYFFIKKK